LAAETAATSSRHTFYQILAHRRWDIIPLLLHPLSKFCYSHWWIFIFSKLLFEVTPKVLNRVEA